jgi:type II secretory pathway component PulM
MNQLWQRLSKRERGLVVATVVILLIVLGRIAVVSPYMARREWVQTQLEIQPQLLEKNLRYIGQKEQLNAALEAARNDIKGRESKLLTGDTPSVNASDLQETVQALAVKEGTQVITTRVLNPEPTGAFSKIAIQMEVGGQVEQVATLVRGIETSPKLLVIDEINVRSLFRPIGLPQQQSVPQAPAQNLRVSITVAGFARGQPAAAKSDGAKELKIEKGV